MLPVSLPRPVFIIIILWHFFFLHRMKILVRIPFTPTRDASQPMIAHEHLVIARKFLGS